MMKDVTIGVIGGSGLYHVEGITVLDESLPDTPWGKPSDLITIGEYAGKKIAFLPRHGRGHFLNPADVPFRANIAALKMMGVRELIAFSAVGSLREEIAPRDFVIPSQIIDRTKGVRPSTFFERGVVAHATFGDPFTGYLGEIAFEEAKRVLVDVGVHRNKTLICMEGPAFSTRAESILYREIGGDIINMSVLPEAKLAREAEIAYQMVCMSTDYDSWRIEEEAVTADYIIGNLNANADNARRLLLSLIQRLGTNANPHEGSMRYAVITSPEKRDHAVSQKLNAILPGYF
jgi:5'-methylthioadenosine phosphorylase